MTLYLHIPFCDSKCGYCAFNSRVGLENLKKPYMEKLTQNLQNELKKYPNMKFTSLYIGGGTPSVVDESLYEGIFMLLSGKMIENAEMNIEANPNSLNESWLKTMKDYGINRLSLGVQSFFPSKLKFLERSHRADSIFQSFDVISKIGLENVSIDLIYGTPFCDETLLRNEINESCKLPINHISAYQLSIDEGSKFFAQKKEQKLLCFSDFSSIGHFVKGLLEEKGFLQYEVSNYTKGHKSLHNLSYWKSEDYLGIGAGAVGCIGNMRYYPPCEITEYLQDKEIKKEILNEDEKDFESLFLGMRCEVGVLETKIKDKEKLALLLSEKKIQKRGNKIYNNDFFLGDEIALFLSD